MFKFPVDCLFQKRHNLCRYTTIVRVAHERWWSESFLGSVPWLYLPMVRRLGPHIGGSPGMRPCAAFFCSSPPSASPRSANEWERQQLLCQSVKKMMFMVIIYFQKKRNFTKPHGLPCNEHCVVRVLRISCSGQLCFDWRGKKYSRISQIAPLRRLALSIWKS